MYKHILVPTDGTKLSQKAIKTATGLAKKIGARITAFYVIAPYAPPIDSEGLAFHLTYSRREYDKAMARVADKALAKATAAAATARVKIEAISVTHPSPWEAIVKAASSRKCDLIVMASHGRSGFAGLLLGSETAKVLTHSKTPVLVCR